MELLVATCVAAVALAGAWPFVWNAGGTARAVEARAEAVTAGAFAARVVGDDLALAVALLPTPAGRAPAEAFAVLHRHPGEGPETVTVVWDGSRRVLWRKASGTYLADRVRSFAVRYFSSDGAELAGPDFAAPDWPARVARLEVTIGAGREDHVATRVLHACLGQS
jgi:hypothetical protein